MSSERRTQKVERRVDALEGRVRRADLRLNQIEEVARAIKGRIEKELCFRLTKCDSWTSIGHEVPDRLESRTSTSSIKRLDPECE